MKHIFTLLFCVILSMPLLAQSNGGKTESDKYTYAKQLIDQGKYQPGIVVLEDMLNMKNVTLQPYALTLMGYAYYQEGNYQEASAQLQKVVSLYSSWNHLDEARYLLGNVYVKEGKVDEAIELFNKITTDSFAENINTITHHSAEDLTYEEVKSLYDKYPNNEIVQLVLLEKLQSLPEDQKDNELLEKLAQNLGVEISKHFVKKSEFKDVYTVAVMLPFFTETTDGAALRVKNEFVYNIYQGILLGKEYLEKRDIKVDVLAFDTKRDTTHIKSLLSEASMKNVDLIVGPLYANMIPYVQAFSDSTGIPMVNPISNNSSIIADHPNAFLVTSTPATIGKSLGHHLREQELAALELIPEEDSMRIKADTVEAYVIFGHSTKEKKMAASFKEAYEEKGGKIAVYQEFDPVDGFKITQELFDPLAKVIEGDSIEFVKDSTAHVFVAVTNEVEALSTISALLSLGPEATTYVPEEWLKFKQLSYGQMESAKINIMFPSWYNDDDYRVKTLIADYQEKFNNQPTDFVFKGFETIFTFGSILHEYGNGFVSALQESEKQRKGYMLPAVNYFESQDNQYVPIIQFVDGDLKNTTPPKFEELD
ncbi:tetratricopeptide repeat protein [Flammeovirga sp. SubArs3]|uniref:tetratricopeptide repeat protein n=1 Tax=Flammeovirga sp. SubArs3 TaxID=2995316 RepID=UPI00248AE7AD|nr:tetratricopeptide repeat protein [Flammeovirga sp. SubArs3]